MRKIERRDNPTTRTDDRGITHVVLRPFWVVVNGKGRPQFYSFTTREERDGYADELEKIEAENERRKAERRKARSEARKAIKNPFKVGDILWNTWGYEQTNVDWAQVIRVTARTVTIRSIKGNVVETGFMSGDSSPCKDQFTSEPRRITLQIFVNYKGEAGDVYLPAEFGTWHKWDGARTVGCSWYH